MNFNSMLYLLEQTAQEKQLTILYVSLFVLVIGMLVLDSLAMNKWGSKKVKILLFVILAVVLVALILLVVTKFAR
ncbi:MAG: hypothetical protein IJ542_00895 [Clostridia bacterium]|nr:hypothetical protein [Clostridia bacterium]